MQALRATALVLSGLALGGAALLAAITLFIFGGAALQYPSDTDWGLTAIFLGLAAVHLVFSTVALVLAIRGRTALPLTASLLMSPVSGLVTLAALVLGPAILFGLSGA